MKDKVKYTRKLKKPDNMELSMLCHQMALVLKSGMNPVEGIPLIAEDISNPRIKLSLESISKRIIDGISVFTAFSEEKIYPAYMLHMIGIGEKTGTLDSVMDNLSAYYETEADIRKRIRSAIVYPSILAALMLGVIALIILKIIPMFGEILASLGGKMPAEAEVLFSFASNMKSLFVAVCIIIFAFLILVALFITIPKGRFIFDRFKINNPISGLLYRKIIAARIGYGLSLTIQSGMNISDSFDSMDGLINNEYVKFKIKEASSKINNGLSFTEVIKEMGVFPELFVRMVRAGERSGNLESMLKKVSGVYARESELALRRLGSTIEPAMVTILSIILGAVLLSVLLPLIGMMSSIG